MTIDALSLVVCTMMGLALGVDYSLLIVSRFREELARGAAPWEAARITRAHRGPHDRVRRRDAVHSDPSLGLPAARVPAALAGDRGSSSSRRSASLDRLVALPGAARRCSASGSTPARSARPRGGRRDPAWPPPPPPPCADPALAAALIAVPLVAARRSRPRLQHRRPRDRASCPARARRARTPKRSTARSGPGWEAPFVLVAAAEQGPITDAARLALLARWQRRIAAEPGRAGGDRPGADRRAGRGRCARSASRTATGRRAPASSTALGTRPATRRRRGRGAARGLDEGRGGQRPARRGRRTGRRRRRTARRGARTAAAGGARASDGGARPPRGRRPSASPRASGEVGGAGTLARPSDCARWCRGCAATAWPRSRALARELEAAAARRPVAAGRARSRQCPRPHLAANRDEVSGCATSPTSVNGGTEPARPRRQAAGGGAGDDSPTRPTASAAASNSLGDGAERLADGLGRTAGRCRRAAERASREGSSRAYPLQTGWPAPAIASRAAATRSLAEPRSSSASSPGLFDSGYFVLSALDGAPPRQRASPARRSASTGGGQAARMLVVSDFAFNSAGSRRVGERLAGRRGAAGRGGRPGDRRHRRRRHPQRLRRSDRSAPALRRSASIVLITFLILVVFLRAPLLAALAVCLNLASVAAAIGVVSLLCKIPDGYPLGGHPYIDTVGAGGDLRRHLRPLDRLRGLPPRPHARALRRSTATTAPRSPSASRRPPG